MDGNHSPPAQPERDGSFNYDIESTDGGPWEPLLRKRATNTTSQIAIIGANVSPIESLDYEYVARQPFPVSTLFCWYCRLL
jgi:chloride channel 7